MIGYAGTDAKCDWLRDLGFDYAFNYKKEDLSETLNKAAPGGIDVYYDNVSVSRKKVPNGLSRCRTKRRMGTATFFGMRPIL